MRVITRVPTLVLLTTRGDVRTDILNVLFGTSMVSLTVCIIAFCLRIKHMATIFMILVRRTQDSVWATKNIHGNLLL